MNWFEFDLKTVQLPSWKQMSVLDFLSFENKQFIISNFLEGNDTLRHYISKYNITYLLTSIVWIELDGVEQILVVFYTLLDISQVSIQFSDDSAGTQVYF